MAAAKNAPKFSAWVSWANTISGVLSGNSAVISQRTDALSRANISTRAASQRRKMRLERKNTAISASTPTVHSTPCVPVL